MIGKNDVLVQGCGGYTPTCGNVWEREKVELCGNMLLFGEREDLTEKPTWCSGRHCFWDDKLQSGAVFSGL